MSSATCACVDVPRVLLPCVFIWYDEREPPTLFCDSLCPSPFRYFIIVRKMSQRSNILHRSRSSRWVASKLLWKTCLTDCMRLRSEFAWQATCWLNILTSALKHDRRNCTIDHTKLPKDYISIETDCLRTRCSIFDVFYLHRKNSSKNTIKIKWMPLKRLTKMW